MEYLSKNLDKIHIEDSGLSYKVGRFWEVELKIMKEQLQSAFDYLDIVSNNPNLIAPALWFNVTLTDVLQTAEDFGKIKEYKALVDNKTTVELKFWNRAFLKTHLSMLAYAKDKSLTLYK